MSHAKYILGQATIERIPSGWVVRFNDGTFITVSKLTEAFCAAEGGAK